MNRGCVLFNPVRACVSQELGTSPMRGKKGAQHKESNKHMLYLGDIKQSKSYQVSVSKRSEIARPEKEKNVGRRIFVRGGTVPALSGSLHGWFFFLIPLVWCYESP